MDLGPRRRAVALHPRIHDLLARLGRVSVERVDAFPSVAMIRLSDKPRAVLVLEDERLAHAERHVLGLLGKFLVHVRDMFDEYVENLVVHSACDESEPSERRVAFYHSPHCDRAIVVILGLLQSRADVEMLILKSVREFVGDY